MNKSKTLLFSLTFLFLFSGSSFGAGKKEYYDNGKFWSKGPLKSETPYNGMGTGWYESGEKKYEVTFKNGGRDGIESWWYESGRKMKRVGYKDGYAEGAFVIWDRSGAKEYEAHYKNGKKEGVERRWEYLYEQDPIFAVSDKKGMYTMIYETHYKNGIEHGIRKEWGRGGGLLYQGNYVNGSEEIK
jgi:antitoxin component YwqK of YwqJK toxin-antitoxin module